MSGALIAVMGGRSAGADLVAFGGSITATAAGASSTASITLGNTGAVTPSMTTSGSESVGTAWGPTGGASWWVLATLTTGSSPSSGTVGTWVNLGTSASWAYTAGVVGSPATGTLRFDFALSSGGAILGSSSVSFSATRTS